MTITEQAAASEVKTCTIGGCEKPHMARGWCAMHYQRWKAHGDPLIRRKAGRPPSLPEVCSIEGCYSPPQSRSWCSRHYQRWLAHGDPLGQYPVMVPTYDTVHYRLRSDLHPSMLRCDHCGGQAEEWAYDHGDPAELISPEGRSYSADLRHYIPLCHSCHVRFDRPSPLSETVKRGTENGA